MSHSGFTGFVYTDLNSTYFIQVELIIATLLFTCLLFPFPFWYYFNPLKGKSIKLAMTFMYIMEIAILSLKEVIFSIN